MSRWWAAIGGASAITIWSWIVSFPLAVVLGISGGIILQVPLGAWLAAVAATQVVLVLPLILARVAVLPANDRRSRPITALAVFATIGVLRVVILAGVARALGGELTLSYAAGWAVSGAVFAMAALSAVAIVVDGLRRHRAVMHRLSALRTAVAAAATDDEASIAAAQAAVLADVEAAVRAALTEVEQASGRSPDEAAQAMRQAAESVIRPLSHRLSEQQASQDDIPTSAVTLPWRERASALVAAMRPVHPLLPAVAIEVLGLPYVVDRTSWPFVFLNLIIGGGALFLLSWILRRLWPANPRTLGRLVLLALAYAVIGGVAAWLSTTVSRAVGVDGPFFWTTVVFYPAIALTMSLLVALDERRRDLEDQTADLLVVLANATAGRRQRLRQLNQHLARVLHSSVQGEFIASAMSISGWTQGDPADVQREIERLSTVVTRRLNDDSEATGDVDDRLTDLLDLWQGMLDISLEITPHARRLLDERADLMDVTGLVIAEGLTNAVRHGRSSHVRVTLQLSGAALHVCIESEGRLDERRRPGLGSRTMDEITDDWSLHEVQGRVVLEATLR